ncbi:hypothetical protein [Brevibacillus sp. H7]|uniref:hypothetical protein n=1 Tax=Brevibacillus sp. H7 TaxID=3349138 RepID=UPI00381166A5
MATSGTTRVAYSEPEPLSIAVSQLVYPSVKVSWRPNAIIVFTGTDYRPVLPAVSLVHTPINAAILYSASKSLSQEIMQEIWRLQPTGRNTPAQVFAVGPFEPEAINRLHQLGLTTLFFENKDPVLQSLHIAEWRRRVLPQANRQMILTNTFLVSLETMEEALPVLGFSAHMGTPILYTHRNMLPELTSRFLQRESSRNVSIIGSDRTISASVEETCRRIVKGTVERFSGDSPSDLAVLFARLQSPKTGIGWGRNQPMKGDAFTFFPDQWEFGMIASTLSHMGKHTPLLPLQGDSLPQSYAHYLNYLRPRAREPKPPFMHAFLLGDMSQISYATQVQIEDQIMFKEK